MEQINLVNQIDNVVVYTNSPANDLTVKFYMKSEHAEQFQPNSVGNIVPENSYKINCKAFSMVVMAEPHFYQLDPEKKEENLTRHLPNIEDEQFRKYLAQAFEQFLSSYYQMPTFLITFGHEHGDNDKKCHLQVCVELLRNTQKVIKPGKFSFFGSSMYAVGYMHTLGLLFRPQRARDAKAVKKYCQKDGDVFYSDPSKALKLYYGSKYYN
jgi:hypothetical protein